MTNYRKKIKSQLDANKIHACMRPPFQRLHDQMKPARFKSASPLNTPRIQNLRQQFTCISLAFPSHSESNSIYFMHDSHSVKLSCHHNEARLPCGPVNSMTPSSSVYPSFHHSSFPLSSYLSLPSSSTCPVYASLINFFDLYFLSSHI